MNLNFFLYQARVLHGYFDNTIVSYDGDAAAMFNGKVQHEPGDAFTYLEQVTHAQV